MRTSGPQEKIFVSISGTKIAETDKAILLECLNANGIQVREWIPLSQVRAIHSDPSYDTNDEIRIEVQEWLLKKKGIM